MPGNLTAGCVGGVVGIDGGNDGGEGGLKLVGNAPKAKGDRAGRRGGSDFVEREGFSTSRTENGLSAV